MIFFRALAEADIAIMKESDDGFIGFFILTDCYNNFVYTEALKSKKKEDVENALKKILKKSGNFNELQGLSTDLM